LPKVTERRDGPRPGDNDDDDDIVSQEAVGHGHAEMQTGLSLPQLKTQLDVNFITRHCILNCVSWYIFTLFVLAETRLNTLQFTYLMA